jgi:CheY-like chemotaxis protein
MDLPHVDDTEPADDTAHAETAAAVSNLLARHGVPPRNQAAQIAQICAISISQARRKLRGAVWLFDEVRAVCTHVGAGLDELFGARPPAAARGAGRSTSPAPALQPARLHIDGLQLDCSVRLGPALTAGATPALVARYAEGQWHVGTHAALQAIAPSSPHNAVDHLQVQPCREPERPRVAVVDDDRDAAEALSDWLRESGWQAQPYTQPQALMAEPAPVHDAYVIDLILAGGQTSQALVEHIRANQPHAPIVLLTGQLREGRASEATLATLLRTQDVTFFEKPVRPAVLMAAIQSSLDRQRRGVAPLPADA